MDKPGPPMNHAELFAAFLYGMEEDTEINNFTPLLIRRVWRKRGRITLFAMVDGSFFVEADGKLSTYTDAKEMAGILLTANKLPKVPILVEAIVRDLLGSPQKDDLQDDSKVTIH